MDIESRMNVLQKRVNRLMSLLIVSIAAIVVLGALYSGAPEADARGNQSANVVKAQKFSVVDSRGQELAALGTVNGETGLVINNNKSQIVLGAANAGTGLFIFDEQNQLRAGVTYLPGDDQGMMAIGDAYGNMEWIAPNK